MRALFQSLMGDRPEDTAIKVIEEARADSARLIASLTRQWEDIVETSALTANDDEHDPEGATVAFERAHLGDMIEQARADLRALDRAAERLRAGEYWTCERCGRPIPPARLAARPAATTCVACASTTPRP